MHNEDTIGLWLRQVVLLRQQQKYSDALDAGEKALEGCRAIGRARGKRAIQALSEVGYVHRILGNLPAAEESLTRALEMTRELYAPDHRAYIEILDRLALLRKDQGRYDEAEVLCGSALDISVKKYGDGHEVSGQLKHNLAVIRERGADGMTSLTSMGDPPFRSDGAGGSPKRSQKKGVLGQFFSRFF